MFSCNTVCASLCAQPYLQCILLLFLLRWLEIRYGGRTVKNDQFCRWWLDFRSQLRSQWPPAHLCLNCWFLLPRISVSRESFLLKLDVFLVCTISGSHPSQSPKWGGIQRKGWTRMRMYRWRRPGWRRLSPASPLRRWVMLTDYLILWYGKIRSCCFLSPWMI